jgi:hypothetical protein
MSCTLTPKASPTKALEDDTVYNTLDFNSFKLTGLPSPNSSTKAGGPWTYEQARTSRNEVYSMALTKKYRSWTNPTSGGAIHINKEDEIEVYQFTIGIFQKVDSLGIHYVEASTDTSVIVKSSELWYNVCGVGQGNETSVLITSEIDPRKSQAFKETLGILWKPGLQIYYLKKG